ncbi:MAG: hypothetical protein QM778_16830 [Myxococcales bacterium]
MRARLLKCVLFAWLALVSSAARVEAQASIDPELVRFGAALQVSSLTLAETHASAVVREPLGLERRRADGWVRAGGTMMVASGGMIVLWAALLDGAPQLRDTCNGAWTPIMMAGPLLVGTGLVVAGAVRRRRLDRQGVQPWPLTRGRRVARVLATGLSSAFVATIGGFVNVIDHACFH